MSDLPLGIAATTQAQPKPTIVLIHGLWMSPASWEDWIAFFESKGYKKMPLLVNLPRFIRC